MLATILKEKKCNEMKNSWDWDLIGATDSLSLEALGEVSSESESPFRVFD